jgi:hypothetical protein
MVSYKFVFLMLRRRRYVFVVTNFHGNLRYPFYKTGV